jgi:hypothetical protein
MMSDSVVTGKPVTGQVWILGSIGQCLPDAKRHIASRIDAIRLLEFALSEGDLRAAAALFAADGIEAVNLAALEKLGMDLTYTIPPN